MLSARKIMQIEYIFFGPKQGFGAQGKNNVFYARPFF
jgi:hypothetical protein